jgi:8-oxo-dGTP pyrophosphatase MutT (NUDIX family)
MYIDLPPPWEWPQPQIGGSTPYAVVVLIFVGTRLVVSEYPKRPGCFVLPGGKVETGEAPWAAALRETKEETGRDALIEAEPFFVGESHNGKPMWASRGVLNGTVPEEWAGPEGRVRLSSIDEVRRHYHPGFLPAFDRVMGAVWPDVLQKVTQERDEIAATLADVAKAKVAAEEALAAAEQVQCDLARERAGAGVSSFSSKNEARGYVCERCGKPCEIEVVREMPRPRSRCCHMPARPAPEPEIDWRAVREAMGAVFAASTEADGTLKDAIGAAWRFLCINNFEDVAQARAQARRLATMANGALQEPINALLRALWVGHG